MLWEGLKIGYWLENKSPFLIKAAKPAENTELFKVTKSRGE